MARIVGRAVAAPAMRLLDKSSWGNYAGLNSLSRACSSLIILARRPVSISLLRTHVCKSLVGTADIGWDRANHFSLGGLFVFVIKDHPHRSSRESRENTISKIGQESKSFKKSRLRQTWDDSVSIGFCPGTASRGERGAHCRERRSYRR